MVGADWGSRMDWLETGPDPYPAIESEAQAARLITTIFGQCLEITYDLSINQQLLNLDKP